MTTVLSPTSSRRLNQDSKVLKKVEEHIVERCVLKSSKHRIESLRQYWRSDHNKTAGLIQALREASKSHILIAVWRNPEYYPSARGLESTVAI
jgi:hypothetical protein